MPAAHRSFVAVEEDDRPDQSYWTAYDHFMVEREARVMRAAYAWSLVAHGWQVLRRRFAPSAADQRAVHTGVGAPHARLMHR